MQEGGETGMGKMSVKDVPGKVRVDLKPVDAAQMSRMTGDLDGTAQILMLSPEEKEDPQVCCLRGSRLLAQECFREALADPESARKGGEDEGKRRYAEGICYMQPGEPPEAFRDLSGSGSMQRTRRFAARRPGNLRSWRTEKKNHVKRRNLRDSAEN